MSAVEHIVFMIAFYFLITLINCHRFLVQVGNDQNEFIRSRASSDVSNIGWLDKSLIVSTGGRAEVIALHLICRRKNLSMYHLREHSLSARQSQSQNISFNDPLLSKQWYLFNNDNKGLNLMPVWKDGITGKGVVVCLIDDGVDYKHRDLKDSFVRIIYIEMIICVEKRLII